MVGKSKAEQQQRAATSNKGATDSSSSNTGGRARAAAVRTHGASPERCHERMRTAANRRQIDGEQRGRAWLTMRMPVASSGRTEAGGGGGGQGRQSGAGAGTRWGGTGGRCWSRRGRRRGGRREAPGVVPMRWVEEGALAWWLRSRGGAGRRGGEAGARETREGGLARERGGPGWRGRCGAGKVRWGEVATREPSRPKRPGKP